MVMYIEHNRVGSSDIQKKVWHVGKELPRGIGEFDYVVIQADGDELEYVRNNFVNLPIRKNSRTCLWEGGFARFILDNLF